MSFNCVTIEQFCRVVETFFRCNVFVLMRTHNEMPRQVTLFGTCAKEKTKKYIIFKNPRGKYEEYVERYCLRAKKKDRNSTKKYLLTDAQHAWKLISSDTAAQDVFLKLKDGEKDFVR